ncbi:hypothetical protein HMI54_008775 [Coelomomyces lativittatus]|nr:hypothetical protein HMI56_003471 [Coelomomyces lativittatus]KAJ1502667.1 hypothetical protein HMI55_002793 [Coelomomyces lativittatus]KAJ1516617.1 hypothetical protein HMI54_008775 [Coelomomyces lativittatus]
MMPPKRPKGLQNSIKKNVSNPSEGSENTHPIEDETLKNSTEQHSIYFEEDDVPNDDLDACVKMLKRAKLLLSQQDHLSEALMLLRGTIHECHRLQALEAFQTNPLLSFTLAKALSLLGIYKTDEDVGTEEAFFQLALDTLHALPPSDLSSLTILGLSPLERTLRVCLWIHAEQFVQVPSELPHVDPEDLIHLIHYVQQRLTTHSSPSSSSSSSSSLLSLSKGVLAMDLEIHLWKHLSTTGQNGNGVPIPLGLGTALFQKASFLFNQWTEAMDEEGSSFLPDQTNNEGMALETCWKVCEEGSSYLLKALELEDHPTEKHYLPLAECQLIQANLAEMLDYDENMVHASYAKAVEYFESALKHAPMSVDEEVLLDLKAILKEFDTN